MAIAYRDSLVTDTSGTASPVVNKPSGVQNGDLMLMLVVTNTNANTATPIAGWARVGTEVDAGTDCTGAVYWKIANNEGSSWTMTSLFDASEIARFFVIAYSGTHDTTPINQSSSRYQDSSSSDVSATSITPNVDGCMIVHLVGVDPSGATPYDITPDTSPTTTERVDAADASNNCHTFVQDWLQTTQGAIALNATAPTDNYAIFEVAIAPSATTTRRAQVSWAELEAPNAPRRGMVSWAEFEVPNGPRRAQLSWAELEVPPALRRSQVSWAELEVPNGPRRSQVSWAELEVPALVLTRRAQLSWAEFEIPTAPRRCQLSWAELEVPIAAFRRAQVSFAELEVPNGPRRAQVSFAELEVPSVGAAPAAPEWFPLRGKLRR